MKARDMIPAMISAIPAPSSPRGTRARAILALKPAMATMATAQPRPPPRP